ncbi:glycine cleavage system aminomethyltransferase GcvT [Micromonospora terminaliae]|uniref:aminomethyltransferase n=1 Tax=Micromonospora terminaliae TaxID=1914461 RepID=A0AAJ2ZGR1_9ACTN|nr:glycine cleavage system aminomethyltransferase GcvT [Micromonospora terminaliae]NES29623.1 glycine cleavage system aminomethyltransferase GcvT [Micromonospora terminaliae]QGL48623.1 glycine cleavage system aminomethyltransferase GcvT [Micromonospora terminaliae]
MTEVTSDAAATRLRRSPLHERHTALGAKFAPFGGWEMPLEYAGGGVLKEHTAVRTGVGVFDVSHLGKARITGPGAADFVNSCLSNDLGRIAPGKAQYTLCCDDATGGVVDDIIAYLYAEDHVFLVPNAANTAEVVRRLRAAAPEGVVVTDEHEAYAVLAVQGPRSAELLRTLGLPTEHDYMSFSAATLNGVELTVCRTGYTGELGYELVVPADDALAVWDALFAAGEAEELRACGLAARDTLRTEMGYPLHGQDLSLDITPVQARSGWAVGWDKPAFWGRDVLRAEKAAGPARTLRGLEAVDRAIPRPGMAVYAGDKQVGTITSGTFSPTKKQGIALALVDTDPKLADGEVLEVDIRGRRAQMRLTRPPFVQPSVR